MECASCRAPNPDGQTFCGGCGARLASTLAPPSMRRYGGFNSFGVIVRNDFANIQLGKDPFRKFQMAHDAGRWALWAIAGTGEGSELVTIPDADVARVVVHPVVYTTRERPGWATFLGVIGLFLFLIGIVFFFIKQDVAHHAAVVEVTTRQGRVLAFRVEPADPVALRVTIGSD